MEKPYPPLYYADYLKVEALTSSQHLRSVAFGEPAHDEMLFIIVHQVYELWFKQILFELESVRDMFLGDTVDDTHIGTAVARLERVTEIEKILIDQLRVLETMTPLDFLDFRDFLFPASGFQSVQFRRVENLLGLRPEQRQLYNQHAYHTRLAPEHRVLLEQTEREPSLHDLVERWLERTPFIEFGGFRFWDAYRDAVHAMLDDDQRVIESNHTLTEEQKLMQLAELHRTRASFEAVIDPATHARLQAEGSRRLSHKAMQAALLIMLYRDQPILHMPFRLLDVLIDIDELLTTWRYRHSLMVHRMIGMKIGTGGSSGHQYLRSTAENHKVFVDLINLSTCLLPRKALPTLPPEVAQHLGFRYGT